mmetsp:Transcript_16574/g.48406  ORF Transcript_16574/g.48406 Transcript_16574/m.48406 type:complete len:203 (-) Transcript_16574:147-755(-)
MAKAHGNCAAALQIEEMLPTAWPRPGPRHAVRDAGTPSQPREDTTRQQRRRLAKPVSRGNPAARREARRRSSLHRHLPGPRNLQCRSALAAEDPLCLPGGRRAATGPRRHETRSPCSSWLQQWLTPPGVGRTAMSGQGPRFRLGDHLSKSLPQSYSSVTWAPPHSASHLNPGLRQEPLPACFVPMPEHPLWASTGARPWRAA